MKLHTFKEIEGVDYHQMILGDTIDEGSYGPIQVGVEVVVVVKMKRSLGRG